MENSDNQSTDRIADLFSVGAHIGYSSSKRHPSMEPFVYGRKNNREVIDLHETTRKLDEISDKLASYVGEGKAILFVGGKSEAQEATENGANQLGMPYVTGRWIGGTLSNFKQIRQQVDKLQSLREQKEKGELGKYTKREQLAFDREIADLERYYDGLIPMTNLPAAMFVVDPDQERIAVREAQTRNIPVYAIANTDCNARAIDDVIPANDSAKAVIDYLVSHVATQLSEAQTQKKEGEKAAESEASTSQQTAAATRA